jgi:hypothetical protein
MTDPTGSEAHEDHQPDRHDAAAQGVGRQGLNERVGGGHLNHRGRTERQHEAPASLNARSYAAEPWKP